MNKWYHVKAYRANSWGGLPTQEASHTTRNMFSAYWKYVIYKLKYDIVELKEEVSYGTWSDR